jgi:hypothetical protein
MKYVCNLINMNKCFSKFAIGSICIVATILIITNSVYMSNAHAQINGNNIGTKRIIEIQKTISSGENLTDDVGNAPPQTNETDIETNETDIETNETDIETNETDIETNRIIIRHRTPSS